ncbi:MAG: PAS domain S-box protein, partial [Anaerolineaceae bacterium]
FLTKGEANPRLLERVIRYAIERKQTSISFSQIQDQLYQLFELSPDAVLVQSEGRYRFANSAALRLFRAEQAEQILGPDLMDFVHPEDRALIQQRVNQVNQKRLPVQKAEFRLCVLDGSVLFVESVATPILYENKPAALVILRDVTERKGFELTITQSEQRFHGLITAFAQVVYRMSPDWQMMRQLIGGDFLKRSEADNPDWWNDYIPPEEQEMVMGRIIHSIRTGEAFDLEHRVIKADGSIGWVQSRAVPIKNDQGEIVEWFGAASNITQRKQVEEEIADDLEFTRLLVEIGQRMVSEDNLQKIFEEILDAAIRFTQADAGVVQILNPETQLLNVLAS